MCFSLCCNAMSPIIVQPGSGPVDVSVNHQCFRFSRHIDQVTPKNIYVHHLKTYFLDQSILKYVEICLANTLLLEVIAAVIPIWCRTLTSDGLKLLDDDASMLFVNGPNINDICFCFLLLFFLIVFCFVISYRSLFCCLVISYCLDFLNSLMLNTL